MPAYRDAVARFIEKIAFPPQPDGCWTWVAGLGSTGYGQFRVNESRKAEKAHRYAYELWVGPLTQGIQVMHACDNPPCVNPDHLLGGTHQLNMTDMGQKGRHFTPWTKPRPQKLNAEQVAEIHSLYVKGSREFGTVALGQRFGVSYTMIHYIVTGQKWNTDLAKGCKTNLATNYRSAA